MALGMANSSNVDNECRQKAEAIKFEIEFVVPTWTRMFLLFTSQSSLPQIPQLFVKNWVNGAM